MLRASDARRDEYSLAQNISPSGVADDGPYNSKRNHARAFEELVQAIRAPLM